MLTLIWGWLKKRRWVCRKMMETRNRVADRLKGPAMATVQPSMIILVKAPVLPTRIQME